ncbi:MAG TPA: PfkB family carbohydrate kinase [Armatimonadota bacterium]|nr:PfkB family carbohydrate kinase [Armatimonadota bacterium]HOM71943.1 PfkB family carbohydrate kinase [Armatimonadota bacterium]
MAHAHLTLTVLSFIGILRDVSYDVIGIGYGAVDFLGIVPSYPSIDAKTEMEQVTIQGGGVTTTAMVAAARLGARVSYIGVTGDDLIGKFALAELQKENVDTSHVIIRHGSNSPFSLIVIDKPTGKRNIFWTNAGITTVKPEELDKEHILSARVLHVDNHEPAAATQAAKWANDAGIPVLMDAGSMRPGVSELIQYVDVLVASHRFAIECTGETDLMTAARKLMTGRRQISVVTNGDNGCACITRDDEFHLPAFKVDVVDTTGAGDVFHGAFSFGLAKGWDARKIAVFASAVAAIKCTKLGGRLGIPAYEETLMFLREHGHNL